MPVARALTTTALLCFVNFNVATCRSPETETGGDPAARETPEVVKLDKVDTSKLTSREAKDWSTYVSELLAPCPDQPVSLAECVKQSRDCELCLPAARFLVTQVTRGKSRSQTEAAFELRFSPDKVKSIAVGDSPKKGASDPTVTVVEWADFECPFCGRARPVLDALVEKYPKQVQLVFKNYPLRAHEHSERAARAAMAAQKQGKFWEMHKALFEHQQTGLDDKTIERLARSIGLDMKKFREDLNSEAVADEVAEDRRQADKLGLRGTPMIYINGRPFELEHFSLEEDLDPWVQLEIERRTGKKVAAKPSGEPSAAPEKAEAPEGDEKAEAPQKPAAKTPASRGSAQPKPGASTAAPKTAGASR